MNKIRSIGLIGFILLSFFSHTQVPPPPPQPIVEVQQDVNNLKTAYHTNIPYTHVYIKIHEDYTIPKFHTTIAKDNELAGINVLEMSNGNYYTNSTQITKENLEKKGLKIKVFFEFQLNGNDAIMYLVSSPDYMMQSYQLVTGDSTFSVLLTGYFPPNDFKSMYEVKQMMLSFIYDKEHIIDYEGNAPFDYDKNASDFKFTDATSNIYMFSVSGVKKQSYEDESFIMVMALPNQELGLTPKSLSFNVKEQIQAQGIELVLIEDSFDKVNNYRAYEALYKGKKDDQNLEFYILTIINEEFAIIIHGRSNKDFKKMKTEMKKFAHSVRIK